MRRDNGYEQKKREIERELPPSTGDRHDGGPWRGPTTEEWLTRIRTGAGLPPFTSGVQFASGVHFGRAQREQELLATGEISE